MSYNDHPPEPEDCPHCGGEMDSHDHGRLWHCPECNAERDVDDDGPEPDDGSDSMEVAAMEWGGMDYP